jgi:hypothetical protein
LFLFHIFQGLIAYGFFKCSLLSPEEFQEACFDDAGIDIAGTVRMIVLPFLMVAKNKKKAGNRGDKEHVLSE